MLQFVTKGTCHNLPESRPEGFNTGHKYSTDKNTTCLSIKRIKSDDAAAPVSGKRIDWEWQNCWRTAGAVNHSLCWRCFSESDHYSHCRALLGWAVTGCLQHRCAAAKINMNWRAVQVSMSLSPWGTSSTFEKDCVQGDSAIQPSYKCTSLIRDALIWSVWSLLVLILH